MNSYFIFILFLTGTAIAVKHFKDARKEKEAAKDRARYNILLKAFSIGMEYNVKKFEADQIPEKIRLLKKSINELDPVVVTTYSKFFDNGDTLVFLLVIFTFFFFISLKLFKSWDTNYQKETEKFINKMESSAKKYEKINKNLFNAHNVLIKELISFKKSSFLNFVEQHQFDEINLALKNFYNEMKNENKHRILADIHNFQRMLIEMRFFNKTGKNYH